VWLGDQSFFCIVLGLRIPWILSYLANQKEEKGMECAGSGRKYCRYTSELSSCYEKRSGAVLGTFSVVGFLVFLGYCNWGIELASLHSLLSKGSVFLLLRLPVCVNQRRCRWRRKSVYFFFRMFIVIRVLSDKGGFCNDCGNGMSTSYRFFVVCRPNSKLGVQTICFLSIIYGTKRAEGGNCCGMAVVCLLQRQTNLTCGLWRSGRRRC